MFNPKYHYPRLSLSLLIVTVYIFIMYIALGQEWLFVFGLVSAIFMLGIGGLTLYNMRGTDQETRKKIYKEYQKKER